MAGFLSGSSFRFILAAGLSSCSSPSLYQSCMAGRQSFSASPLAGNIGFCGYAYGGMPVPAAAPVEKVDFRAISGNTGRGKGAGMQAERITPAAVPKRNAGVVENMAKPDFPPAPDPYEK